MPTHLSLDLYRLALRDRISPELLLEHAHQHLLEACGVCASEYQVDQEEESSQPAFRARRRSAAVPENPQRRGIHLLERRLEQWQRVQHERRRAKENLRHLRKHPPEQWVAVVEEAQSRFRTRAFAELLIQESEALQATDPPQARRLADLVPVVLHWLPGADRSLPWTAPLLARARQARTAVRRAG